MAAQIIPLTSDPNQTFQTTLTIDNKNVTLQLTLKYNEMANCWNMSISDSQGVLMIDSVPLITGNYPSGNILDQYSYLEIGSAYIVKSTQIAKDFPDSTNLGTDFLLVWDDTK